MTPEDDIPDNASTTAATSVGTPFVSDIAFAGDRDWVAVELVAGVTYTFALDGAGSMPLSDPYVVLRDSDGLLLSEDDDSGPATGALLSYTAAATATYYVDAGAADGGTGAYSLLVTETDDVAASVTTSATLSFVDNVAQATGNIDVSGDHDWYRVDLVAGQTYLAGLAALGNDGNGLDDAFLTVRDATGAALFKNDEGGDPAIFVTNRLSIFGTNEDEAVILFEVAETGTYFLDVSDDENGTGAFNLTAEALVVDGEISEGDLFNGSIDVYDDAEWICHSAWRGSSIRNHGGYRRPRKPFGC